MKMDAGKILISSPSLADPHFDKVVIFITEYNKNGAMGFVLNKIFPRVFNELLEFKQSQAFTLYAGGPVENEHLYFLHCRPDKINDGSLITANIYLGGKFTKAVQGMDDGSITRHEIKLFIGYCGWEPGQLDEELKEGSWLLCDADSSLVFTGEVKLLWEDLYKRLG